MSFDLFIDTNIYLSFYELSKDDNKTLGNTFLLNTEDEFRLLCSQQVADEFWRMRPKVISSSLKNLNELRPPAVPTMAMELAETKVYEERRKLLAASHKALIGALESKIAAKELFADILVKGVFAKATKMAVGAELLQRARDRVDCGNPPGKKGSLGDAINWELLLANEPSTKNMIII